MSDLINRQVAIDALERSKDKTAKGDMGGFYNTIIQNNIDKIKSLPSAHPEHECKNCIFSAFKQFRNDVPERNVGKWIGTEFDGYADGYPVFYEWKCSECGCIFEDEEPTYNYCPRCGAKMDGII